MGKDSFPWDVWSNVLASYASTEVTYSGNGIVALRGVAGMIRSRSTFPGLQDAVYNSGVWSGSHVLRQVLWTRNRDLQLPSFRVPTTTEYPLPSWSLLSCPTTQYQNLHESNEMIAFPPSEHAKVSSVGLDQFGRPGNLHGCILQLKGILVPIKIIESTCTLQGYDMVCPRGSDGVSTKVFWDNVQEEEAARSAVCCIQALVCFSDTIHPVSYYGTALRPCNDLGGSDGARICTRCGYFETWTDWTAERTAQWRKAWRLDD